MCCQLCCTDYIFIIQLYSSYIWHLWHLRLKIDFDTDLTPNITRHSCIILAELVVSSFINNLVRLSSVIPFHIHLSNKLYTEGITLHTNTTTLRHFFTHWLFIIFPAFSTPANLSSIFISCIFHSCKLVLHFHVPQFPPVQTGAANSCLAFSGPSFLTVPYFHVSHFQSPPYVPAIILCCLTPSVIWITVAFLLLFTEFDLMGLVSFKLSLGLLLLYNSNGCHFDPNWLLKF